MCGGAGFGSTFDDYWGFSIVVWNVPVSGGGDPGNGGDPNAGDQGSGGSTDSGSSSQDPCQAVMGCEEADNQGSSTPTPNSDSCPSPYVCLPSSVTDPNNDKTLTELFTVYNNATTALNYLFLNVTMVGAGVGNAVAGVAAIVGGCAEPTPAEPLTCGTGVFAGGVAFTSAGGIFYGAYQFFKNYTLRAFEQIF